MTETELFNQNRAFNTCKTEIFIIHRTKGALRSSKEPLEILRSTKETENTLRNPVETYGTFKKVLKETLWSPKEP